MQRRKFLIGTGALAAGGAAALGSGAFSRVEAQRAVSIEVATDENAYLGLKPMDTPNSNNYVSLDDEGHLQINIGEHDDFAADPEGAAPGQGVNSDSHTYFDGMVQLCNQGKADAFISYELPPTSPHPDIGDDWLAANGEQAVGFYYDGDTDDDPTTEGREFIQAGPQNAVRLPLGQCVEIGVRTVTKGVDATVDESLIDGEVVVTARSPNAGATGGGT